MAKVTNVACKLPSGMIVSHGRMVMEDGKPKLDPRTGLVSMENVKEVRLYGALHKDNPDKEEPAFGGNVAGFGITKGVDAEWFDNWMETHLPYLPALQENMIFAIEDGRSVASKARELRDLKSGLQPLEANDERVPEAREVLDKADLTKSD